MTDRIEIAGLQIARELHDFVAGEALPGTGIDAAAFWSGFSAIVHDLAPKNRALLRKRDEMQERIDRLVSRKRRAGRHGGLQAFLTEIGYLVPEGPAFQVATENVDPEIAVVAGPQLVVPVMNARYALNAANARWGSLYDALYGTDAISEEGGAERGKGYNPARGEKVIAWAREFLDDASRSTAPRWRDMASSCGRRACARIGSAARVRSATVRRAAADRARRPGAVCRLPRRRRTPRRRSC